MTNRDQYEDSNRSERRARAAQRAQSTYQGQRVSREARQARSNPAYQNQERATYSRDNYRRSQPQGEGASPRPSARNSTTQYSRANYGVQRNQAGHYGRDQYGRSGNQKKKINVLPFLGIIALLVVVVGGGAFAWANFGPIKVKVNGVECELSKDKNVQEAFEVSGVKVTPGNFIAVDDSVIEKGQGTPYTVTVNGKNAEAKTKVSRDAVIEFTDGTNIKEEYTQSDEEIPATTEVSIVGSIRAFEGDGSPGVKSVLTGKTSGKTVSQVTREPGDIRCHAYYPDTNGEKVIALTIDDGPWPTYTKQVLDILEENKAVATFFVVGNCVEQQTEGASLVKREAELGCQVCTHTYDHAEGSGQGVNITYMSPQEQIDEIEKGRKVITDVTGKEASKVVRFPGGNINEATFLNLKPYVTAEINWSLDTEDWRRPGADAIYNRMMQAGPGSIILCHDGGGDRSQTVEALRRAIPALQAQGYKFITMDEMLKYPAKAQS